MDEYEVKRIVVDYLNDSEFQRDLEERINEVINKYVESPDFQKLISENVDNIMHDSALYSSGNFQYNMKELMKKILMDDMYGGGELKQIIREMANNSD